MLSSCNWPLPRFGPAGTGFNPSESTIGVSNVSGLHERWFESSEAMSRQGSLPEESSPVVANGLVYASSSAGRLNAFDASNGTGKWFYSKSSPNVATLGSEPWVPSPAVNRGVVYDMAGDGTLYAIEARTGTKVWSITTGSATPSSLVVANGVVFVAASAGLLFAFNATTGALLWTDNLGLSGDHPPAVPAVAKGMVYATLGGRLSAYNATTGGPLWRSPTVDSGGYSSPAVVGGVVYVCDPSNLFAFSATTGASLWSAATGAASAWPASPAVANGVVYTNSNTGKLSAFNATTGAPIWSTAIGGGGIVSSPAVANGVVYVGGGGGLSGGAFNATTGMQLWTSGETAFWVDIPVIANGVVYASYSDAGGGFLDALSPPIPGAGLTVDPTYFSPFDVLFGPVLDGTSTPSSPPVGVTVTNFGSSPTATITDSFVGADSSQFETVSDSCTGKTLAGGARCAIEFVFAPTLPGALTAKLVVSATNAGSAGVTVSGTGNALSIAGAANYGTVPDGTSSSPTTFTVVNHSSTTVSPTVTSPAGSQFTATSDSCAGSTLGPHRTCHIAVVFAPTGIGSAQANLTASTTPGVTTSVTLSGIGSWFAIHPQTKDYGTVSVGSSATATFTITNMVSTAEGADTSLQTTGGFSITSDMCNGVTLAPGASCTIVVSFTPSVTGASYSGTLDLIFPFVLVGQITVFGRGG